MYIELGGCQIPVAWALAVVAALAYVLGRCGRRPAAIVNEQFRELERELHRARLAAAKLERIVWLTGARLGRHRRRLRQFRNRVVALKEQSPDDAYHELCREVEEILSPTVRLTAQIASAHDIIRYESSLLMTLSDSRTDALTGIGNRRGLDRALVAQLAMMDRYGTPCSLVLLDIDRFKDINDRQGHLGGDQMLRDVAGLLKEEAREVDMVARYGGDEFTIVMVQTGLEGAVALAERLRRKVQQQTSLTVSSGVASARKGDSPDSLFRRADAALYSAKVAGRNCVYCHDGEQAAAVPVHASPAPSPAAPLPLCQLSADAATSAQVSAGQVD